MLSAQLCLTIITSHIYPYRPFFFSVHSLLFCAFSTLREAGNPILPPSSLPSAPPRTTTHLPAPTAPTSPQPGPPQPCLLPTPQRSGPAPSPQLAAQRCIPGTSLASQREVEEGRSRGGSSRGTDGGRPRGAPHTRRGRRGTPRSEREPEKPRYGRALRSPQRSPGGTRAALPLSCVPGTHLESGVLLHLQSH